MRIFSALKTRKYLGIAVLSALGIGLFLPLAQTGFEANNMLAWYLTLIGRPLNTAIYIGFSILFGLLVSLQFYNKEVCKTCNVKMDNKKGSSIGAAGASFGFLLGICPACIGLIAVFLPLTVSITLTNYSWLFMGIAIIVMIASIHLLGGFKKE